MDNLVERLVCAVVLLFFIGYEFVTARNGHIDATTVRISFLVGVIGLLDGDIAAVNVVAKFLQPRRFFEHEIVDLVGFLRKMLRRKPHIGCNERKCAGNFEGSVLTRSDLTCSTIRSRTLAGKRSTMAAWIDAGAANDQPSTPSLCTIFTI